MMIGDRITDQDHVIENPGREIEITTDRGQEEGQNQAKGTGPQHQKEKVNIQNVDVTDVDRQVIILEVAERHREQYHSIENGQTEVIPEGEIEVIHVTESMTHIGIILETESRE